MKKFKVVIKKSPEEMKYGGQSSYGLNLGHRTVYADMPDNPHEELNKTLKPVPRSQAKIEAEEGETALGDFDGDGQLEHLNIGGQPHSKGGTPLDVPDGTFIYSNTKKMKIGGAVLANFGKNHKDKKRYTPAQLAKQYDINKYKAILSDPNADNLSKKTARTMVANYEKKLAELALLQEGMKGFPQGIPNVARPLVEKMQQQGNKQQMAAYGGMYLHGGNYPQIDTYSAGVTYDMGGAYVPDYATMANSGFIYDKPTYAKGGQSDENLLKKVAILLQQGIEPQKVYEELIQAKIPQKKAELLIKTAMQGIGGGDQQSQMQSGMEQQVADPSQQQMVDADQQQMMQQPGMAAGGTFIPNLADAAYGVLPKYMYGMGMAEGGQTQDDLQALYDAGYHLEYLAYGGNTMYPYPPQEPDPAFQWMTRKTPKTSGKDDLESLANQGYTLQYEEGGPTFSNVTLYPHQEYVPALDWLKYGGQNGVQDLYDAGYHLQYLAEGGPTFSDVTLYPHQAYVPAFDWLAEGGTIPDDPQYEYGGLTKYVNGGDPGDEISEEARKKAKPVTDKSKVGKDYEYLGKADKSEYWRRTTKGKPGKRYTPNPNAWWRSLTPAQKAAHNAKVRQMLKTDPTYTGTPDVTDYLVYNEPDITTDTTTEPVTTDTTTQALTTGTTTQAVITKPGKRTGWLRPDKWALAAAMAFPPKAYQPSVANINAVMPIPTFYDPGRELAKTSENAAMLARQAGYYSPQGFSNIANYVQANAAPQQADILAKYNNLNVGVANQYAPMQAEIANKLAEYRANRANAYRAGVTTMNQNLDNANRAYLNTIANVAIPAEYRAWGFNLMNQTHPNLKMSNLTGNVTLRPGMNAFDYITSGQGGAGTGGADYNAYVNEAKRLSDMKLDARTIDALMRQKFPGYSSSSGRGSSARSDAADYMTLINAAQNAYPNGMDPYTMTNLYGG